MIFVRKEEKYRIAGGPSSHVFLRILVVNVRREEHRQTDRQTDRGGRSGKKKKKEKKKDRGRRSPRIAKQKIRGDRLSGARSYD